MGEKCLVVAVQMSSNSENPSANLQRMRSLALNAAEALGRIDLIVYPELALTGLRLGSDLRLRAMPLNAHHVEFMADLCSQIRTWSVYGVAEIEGSQIFNAAAVVGPDGLVGVYRKVHLWGEEIHHFSPGSEYQVFALPFASVGCLICYDLNFPEAARIAALKGAQLVALPSAWDWQYLKGWELCLKARAYDNLVFLVAPGQWGSYEGGRLLGHTRIVSPSGEFLASLGDFGDGWCAAEVDLSLPQMLEKEGHRFLKDRRPETYGELATPRDWGPE